MLIDLSSWWHQTEPALDWTKTICWRERHTRAPTQQQRGICQFSWICVCVLLSPTDHLVQSKAYGAVALSSRTLWSRGTLYFISETNCIEPCWVYCTWKACVSAWGANILTSIPSLGFYSHKISRAGFSAGVFKAFFMYVYLCVFALCTNTASAYVHTVCVCVCVSASVRICVCVCVCALVMRGSAGSPVPTCNC